MTESLTEKLARLDHKLSILPETNEPPLTVLQIIRNNQQEQEWQQLLFHYLSPNEAHGLDYALLEHLLLELSDRDDLGFTFSRLDFAEIQIEQEVSIANGRRPDAVIWSAEDWYICWELKIDASEGEDQTTDYVDANSFQSINLQKENVPEDSRHYVYLAPENSYSSDPNKSPPEAKEFIPVSWEWVADEINTFLIEAQGEYPARTTAQLETFTGTIQRELKMTEYQENYEEKVELYHDYYSEISDVQQAFEEEWGEFIDTWGDKLAYALDSATITDDSAVPDEYASIELTMENNEARLWTFRQGHANWGWMFPREWWTKLDEKRPIFDNESPMARVGFLHRPSWNQDEALRDHELIFQLRNAPTANDDFHEKFQSRFNDDSMILKQLPSKTSRPDVKQDVLEASYNINPEYHEDFFEAYIAALARAIDEHVVSNPELVNRIDSIYQQTIEEDTQF